jgi:large subunit ribosomal protein L21
MYAVIQESGKQFKVSKGDRILVDREHNPDVKTITFDQVLLTGGDGKARIGTPTLAGVTVTADVLGPKAGKKIDIQKYKRRKGYHRRIGHRQHYLQVQITGISG